MTRSELEHRLRVYFDKDPYYSSGDFTNAIQDGYDECAAFSGCIVKSTTVPFSKLLTFYDMKALIPDLLGIIAIYNSTIRRWMIPTSLRKLDMHQGDLWETQVGSPEFFAPISFRYMAIYKKPGADNYGNMFIYYKATAPTAGNTDTLLIPDEHITSIENYCKVDLQEQAQEFQKASLLYVDYQEALNDLIKWSRSRRMPDKIPFLKG